MGSKFRVGDRVSWNSEAGRVAGIITKEIISLTLFKGYMRHASKEEPQYLIKSEKTDHVAIHKASALRKLKKRPGGLHASTAQGSTAYTRKRRRKT